MESADSSKKIRELLKLGSPVQKLFDSLDGPLFGNLFLISGGSNSGKTLIGLKFLEHFTSKKNNCAYFDLENSFDYLIRDNKFPNLVLKNVIVCNRHENFNMAKILTRLKQNLIEGGSRVFFIDYIQLVEDYEDREKLKALKDFAKENNMLGFLLLNESKIRQQSPLIPDFCNYQVRTSKDYSISGEIDVNVVKNNFSIICKRFTISSK